MPFDPYLPTVAPKNLAEQLAAIGLVAVPSELVTSHMRKVEWYDRSRGHWEEVRLPSGDKLVGSLRDPRTLKRRGLSRWSAAPRRVRNLAAEVQANIPEAEFYLGYFKSDPYLRIRGNVWGCDRGYETAYLALWNNRFSLIAIATRIQS